MNLNILDTHTHLYNPHRKTNKFTPLNVPFTDFEMLDNITISDNYFQNEKVAALKIDYLGNCFSTHFINLFSGFGYNTFTLFDVYKHTGDEVNNVQLFLFYLIKHDLIRCDENGLRIVPIDVLQLKDGTQPPLENPPTTVVGKVKYLEDTLLYLEQQAGTGESLTQVDALYKAVKSMVDGLKYELPITILALTNESDSEAINAVIGDFTTLKQAVVDGKIIKIGGIVVSNTYYSEEDNAVSIEFNNSGASSHKLKTKNIIIQDTDGVLSALVFEKTLPDDIATIAYVDTQIARLGSSGGGSSGVYELNANILNFTSETSSDEISNTIGGIAGFNALKRAISNKDKIILILYRQVFLYPNTIATYINSESIHIECLLHGVGTAQYRIINIKYNADRGVFYAYSAYTDIFTKRYAEKAILRASWSPSIAANSWVQVKSSDIGFDILNQTGSTSSDPFQIAVLPDDTWIGGLAGSSGILNIKKGGFLVSLTFGGGTTTGSGGAYTVIKADDKIIASAYNPRLDIVNSLPSVSCTYKTINPTKFTFFVWRESAGMVNTDSDNPLRITCSIQSAK